MRITFVALDDMLCEWMLDGLHETGHDISWLWLNTLHDVNEMLVPTMRMTGSDLIVYAGPAGGPHAPSPETLRDLRRLAPSVFLCFDGSDIGWHGLLADYRREGCFDLIVNCDGCDEWPKTRKDYTTWCPVGQTAFSPPLPLDQRPINFGFCGGHRSDPRYTIVSSLIRTSGLVVKPRDDRYARTRNMPTSSVNVASCSTSRTPRAVRTGRTR